MEKIIQKWAERNIKASWLINWCFYQQKLNSHPHVISITYTHFNTDFTTQDNLKI